MNRKNRKISKKSEGGIYNPPVRIPGGGIVIYTHATGKDNVSRPLSRADAVKFAKGPLAAMQTKLSAELARVDEEKYSPKT